MLIPVSHKKMVINLVFLRFKVIFLTTLFMGLNHYSYFGNKKNIIIMRLKADSGQCSVTLYIVINKNVNTNNS